MKTERRHELEANELAIRLGKITEAIQPRARAVMAVIVAIVAIVLIIQYTGSSSTTRQTEGWNRYATAIASGDIFELDTLGDDFKKAPVGNWARLILADQHLMTGVRETFRDRAQANTELNKAITNYESVRAEARHELLKQRAHFGLGRSHEALSKLAEAERNYQAVVDGWPNSAMAVAAQSRLDDLALARTREFYDWFAQQTPQADFLRDQPGTPGARPEFDLDALLSPSGDVELDLNAPVTDDEDSAGSDTFIRPLFEESGSADDTPVDDFPVDDSPVDDFPVEDDTAVEGDAAVEGDDAADVSDDAAPESSE
jgi:hypothetical protein